MGSEQSACLPICCVCGEFSSLPSGTKCSAAGLAVNKGNRGRGVWGNSLGVHYYRWGLTSPVF